MISTLKVNFTLTSDLLDLLTSTLVFLYPIRTIIIRNKSFKAQRENNYSLIITNFVWKSFANSKLAKQWIIFNSSKQTDFYFERSMFCFEAENTEMHFIIKTRGHTLSRSDLQKRKPVWSLHMRGKCSPSQLGYLLCTRY